MHRHEHVQSSVKSGELFMLVCEESLFVWLKFTLGKLVQPAKPSWARLPFNYLARLILTLLDEPTQ